MRPLEFYSGQGELILGRLPSKSRMEKVKQISDLQIGNDDKLNQSEIVYENKVQFPCQKFPTSCRLGGPRDRARIKRKRCDKSCEF